MGKQPPLQIVLGGSCYERHGINFLGNSGVMWNLRIWDMNKWNKRWKLPGIGKLRMRMRTLKRIWRGILVKGLVFVVKGRGRISKRRCIGIG